MRHNKKVNHLSRTSAHRKALLANMANSLIQHKRITTTVAKAKALRKYVEPLITKAKSDTTHSRRVVFSYLQDKDAVSELFREIAGKITDRPGGYTRILKTGTRIGDNAEMCIIELVDYNEAMLAAKEEAGKAKKRRSRRGGAKKTEEAAPVAEKKAKTEKPKKEAAVKAVKPVEEVKPAEEAEKTTEPEVKTEAPAEAPETDESTGETAEEGSEEEKKEE